MSTLPAMIGAPASPQVTLLPPEFGRRKQKARLRMLALLIVLVAVLVVVGAWLLAAGFRTAAELRLAAEQERRVELSAELASYDYVREAQETHTQVTAAQALAGSTDVMWDAYLTAIADALPDGVEITSLEVAQASPSSGLGQSSGTPFAQPDVGALNIAGSATSPARAMETVDALSAISGLAEVTVSNVSMSSDPNVTDTTWTFDLTARVTYEALSGRVILEEDTDE